MTSPGSPRVAASIRPGAHRAPLRRPGTDRLLVAAVALATFLGPATGAAQVTGVVDVRDRQGQALVRNPSDQLLRVEVVLWESDEAGEQVELTAPARGSVWPTHFELPPRQTQTIRLLLDVDAYGAGRLLRLEIRMVPVPPPDGTAEAGGARGRILLATRVLAKVRVH